MLIYLPVIASLLSLFILSLVYLGDRYEREPIERIQNWFLLGVLVQMILILTVNLITDLDLWAGPWILVTVTVAAFGLPLSLRHESELDESYDGIVYTVACLGGATSVIHVFNLPKITAASEFASVLAPDRAPDLRDLLILAGSESFAADLGQGLVILIIAVLIGATLGLLHLRGHSTASVIAACLIAGHIAVGLELAFSGSWLIRIPLIVMACTLSFLLKRHSVFRDRPQTTESDVLVQGLKTVLMVLGSTLIAAAVLMTVQPPPDVPVDVYRPTIERS